MMRNMLETIGLLHKRPVPRVIYRFPLISPGGGESGYVDIVAATERDAVIASRFAVDTSRVLIGPPTVVET